MILPIALTIGIALEISLIRDIKKCQEAEKIMYSLKKQQEE